MSAEVVELVLPDHLQEVEQLVAASLLGDGAVGCCAGLPAQDARRRPGPAGAAPAGAPA